MPACESNSTEHRTCQYLLWKLTLVWRHSPYRICWYTNSALKAGESAAANSVLFPETDVATHKYIGPLRYNWWLFTGTICSVVRTLPFGNAGVVGNII